MEEAANFGDAAEILFASELIPEKRCEDTLGAMKHQADILQHLAMEQHHSFSL
ncbi:MAG: hypothetical protein LUD01_04315 [Clostridiales bacterium]|nr:hypothetical protein [Clostridiales bacterium]